MPLSCSCDYDDSELYYLGPKDYSVARPDGNRKRCSSCKEQIEHGAVCTEFERYRSPNSDIEERIHGDEVMIASMWLCERCSDLYFSFEELGYECVGPWEDMSELAEEYAETHKVQIQDTQHAAETETDHLPKM